LTPQRALIYHDLARAGEHDTVGFPGLVAARYKLEPTRFEAHLDAIASTGMSVGQVGTAARASLTFDDGGASALEAAARLERHGWKGSFFVVTDRIGTPGFLSADSVKELARRGHDVGSHSHTHPADMARLAPDRLAQEWHRSRSVLEQLIGDPPRAAAVPGGSVSQAVIVEAARAGYELLLTSTPTGHRRHVGRMLVMGRYTIWADDPPRLAAAYARGDRVACLRSLTAWQIKSAAKRISPVAYETARDAWAQRCAPR
jgi:peptidoglycan/xylan/chitin deacetylase (PgdA/CDA1 family)